MYVPKHFVLEELLPRQIYFDLMREDKLDYAWGIFDDRILWTADALRIRYGKMIVNTWKWGGLSQFRGWRPFDCKVGADWSQHKFGRALDLVPAEVSVEKIRSDIKAEPFLEHFMYITCIEDNVSWLHFDCRNWDKIKDGLLIV